MTANPLTLARHAVAEALSGVGAPVHATPPGAISGPCVWLTATTCDPHGRVTVQVTVASPTPGREASIETVEQVAFEVQMALAATRLLGWGEISAPTVDKDSGLLTRTVQASIRPTLEVHP